MLLTEAEAAKCDCPMQSTPEGDVKCPAAGGVFAHGCPVWRWAQKSKHVKSEEGTWRWEKLTRDQWTGFCGLGGKVEE